MLELFHRIAASEWSTALRESLYVWPFVESLHVLTLALFAGTAIAWDLRLLGLGLRSIPMTVMTGRLLPWTRGGFVVMALTGGLLFYANPARYYQNVFFRLKVIVLLVVAFNIWWFHRRTHREVSRWDTDPTPPRAARYAAIVSLVGWAAIIVAGRLVAYNWFDCDIQPQSDLINALAGCVPPPPGR